MARNKSPRHEKRADHHAPTSREWPAARPDAPQPRIPITRNGSGPAIVQIRSLPARGQLSPSPRKPRERDSRGPFDMSAGRDSPPAREALARATQMMTGRPDPNLLHEFPAQMASLPPPTHRKYASSLRSPSPEKLQRLDIGRLADSAYPKQVFSRLNWPPEPTVRPRGTPGA